MEESKVQITKILNIDEEEYEWITTYSLEDFTEEEINDLDNAWR